MEKKTEKLCREELAALRRLRERMNEQHRAQAKAIPSKTEEAERAEKASA